MNTQYLNDILLNNRPIALYNADRKELIGVFAELIYAAKYIMPTNPLKAYNNLHHALKRKGAIRKSIFNFSIAVRFANETQINELCNEKAIIKNNYQSFDISRLTGIHTFGMNDQKINVKNSKR